MKKNTNSAGTPAADQVAEYQYQNGTYIVHSEMSGSGPIDDKLLELMVADLEKELEEEENTEEEIGQSFV